MTDVVRVGSSQYSADILLFMQKFRCIFLIFYLMLVNLLGLGISEIRDMFFHGPIWMRLRNSGSVCVGQVPGTSHIATRPKRHTCERRICPSLSRPFAAGPASSLFVVVQSVLECDTYTRYNGSSFSSFPPIFLFFFVGWFFKKKTGTRGNNIVCWCLLYFFLIIFLFRVSFTAEVYATGPHGDCVVSTKQRIT